jgi:3'-5' exoribonuclease
MISDFVAGTEVVSFFLVSSKPEVRKAKNGSGYLVLKLLDKSAEIEARLWGMAAGAESPVKEGSIVKVKAEVTEWQEAKQLKVSQIREVGPGDEYDEGDMFPCSARPPEEMWADLLTLLNANMKFDGYLRRLLKVIMNEHGEALRRAPAAKRIHHSYLGGLLTHILSMCQSAVFVADHYSLDKELLLTGCVLHDSGKIF